LEKERLAAEGIVSWDGAIRLAREVAAWRGRIALSVVYRQNNDISSARWIADGASWR
jgi:hypothetical protein